MSRSFRPFLFLAFILSFCGCASAPKDVSPKFGLQTMTLLGAIKFEHGTNSIVGDVAIRYERPQRFEMVVTKGPTVTLCYLVADGNNWKIEFPPQNRLLSGTKTPGNEELALWVESRTIVAEAIQRAQFADPFTESLKGEYKSGREFQMELREFRGLVGQVFATRMKLTCTGCKSSLEIVIHELK